MIPLALELLTCTMISAGPPLVHYTTKAVTKSWEPIDIKQVEKLVEAAALKRLTASGGMRLKKTGFADLRKGEYSLIINGRFIEEAERFSVYLSFAEGSRKDLPSFRASDTSEPLGRKKRSKMQQLISQAVDRAAKRLAEVLAPQLESVRLRVEPPPLESPTMPFEWGQIDVPPVRSKSKAIRDLLDVRNQNHIRSKALAEIKGHVFDQQAARNAVELCLLRDPEPKIRSRCADALEAKARNHVPTQRVILHAMRTEVDESVIKRLAKISSTFVGLSRMETIATWLHLVASSVTPARAVDEIVRVLQKEGDVPNLDFAVAACLQQEVLVYGRRGSCASYLLPNIPQGRQRAVVWKFLQNASEYNPEGHSLFETVIKKLMRPKGRGVKPDPAYGEIFLKIAERKKAGWRVRSTALYEGEKVLPRNEKTVERLLKMAYDQEVLRGALRAIDEVTDDVPELRKPTLAALGRLKKEGRFYKRPSRADPNRDLDDAIKRMERAMKRKPRRR